MIGELSILTAIGIGALHSMEPGHGKSILSAYIVSSRAKVWQAIILGLISSISHALSIFFIAFLVTLSVHTLTPESFIHWIELFSGLLIITIGFSRMRKLLTPQIIVVKKWNGSYAAKHEEHHHHFHHEKQPTTLFQFILVGFLAGIIPCPSALAIILAAVGSHHLYLGIQLVVAFSIGGALTMSILGFMISRVSEKINQKKHTGIIKITAFLSSFFIFILGLLIFVVSINHLFVY